MRRNHRSCNFDHGGSTSTEGLESVIHHAPGGPCYDVGHYRCLRSGNQISSAFRPYRITASRQRVILIGLSSKLFVPKRKLGPHLFGHADEPIGWQSAAAR